MKLSALMYEVLVDLVEADDPDVVHFLLETTIGRPTRTALEWRGMVEKSPAGKWRLTDAGVSSVHGASPRGAAVPAVDGEDGVVEGLPEEGVDR